MESLGSGTTISDLAYSVLMESKVYDLDPYERPKMFNLDDYRANDALVNSMAATVTPTATFASRLSRITDQQDLMVRKAVIAGRVSSGAASIPT